MLKKNLIACFQDTIEKSRTGSLACKTAEAIKSNKVYKEGFVSGLPKGNENAAIRVEKGTTFHTARRYRGAGKIVVLNFANPENPGGGVSLGAMAQEECLCRSSNLYPCISDNNVFGDYYLYHRNMGSYLYSDRLIYTKDVTVFKDDNTVPALLPEEDWFTVDVITCAAPYLGKQVYINQTVLRSLFKKRIQNIFEAARDNEVDILILGAFGCGAFKNPPAIVAEAFRKVICEQGYRDCFKEIVFAIKPSKESYCQNIDNFVEQFEEFDPEALQRCGIRRSTFDMLGYNWLGEEPVSLVDEWREKNKYFKKQFSILGDSISTLEGYNPVGYKVFYNGDNCVRSGVRKVTDTWWDKVIDFFGGELLVNNSWSGSRVTKLPYEREIYPRESSDEAISLFPSGCSDERTSSLHIGDVRPDVILVYLGTNDWAFGAKLGDEIYLLDENENERFEYAYGNMLEKLKANYPQSEIWCCTLSETYIAKRPDFEFPHEHGGKHIEEYNEVIRRVVCNQGCKLVDLFSFRRPYDTMDGSHPTELGMHTIAAMVIRSVNSEEGYFLNWMDERYDHKEAEQPPVQQDYSTGQILAGRYEILDKIGQGYVSKVYRVRDTRIGKVWAMKVCGKKERNFNPVIRDAIVKETCLMKQLAHPAIPAVIDIQEDEDAIYIVRDYVEGETLEAVVTKYGAQPPEIVIGWAKQLCGVLEYLHAQMPPIIYRDMKPANVMLTRDGWVKLIDFGIARTYKQNQKEDTCFLGTRWYAAPEQYGGAQTDARTDIYGLGMTMFRIVTGVNFEDIQGNIHPIRTYNSNLPVGLEYIITKCTQPNPADRYQSCTELMADLNDYLNLPKPKGVFGKLFGKK